MSVSPLRFCFDYVSPYSYLAWTQIHALAGLPSTLADGELFFGLDSLPHVATFLRGETPRGPSS